MSTEPIPKLYVFGEPGIHPYFYKTYGRHIKLPLGRVSFIYGDKEIPIAAPHLKVTRNLKSEGDYIKSLLDSGARLFSKRYANLQLPNVKPFDFIVTGIDDKRAQEAFLQKIVPELKELGWEIQIDQSFPVKNVVLVDEWYTELKEKKEYNWFNMELGFILDGKKINILPLLIQLLKKHPELVSENYLNNLTSEICTLTLPNGQSVNVPVERIRGILSTLTEIYDNKSLDFKGQLTVPAVRASQLLELEKAMNSTKMRWFGEEKLKFLNEKLQNFKEITSTKIPTQFKGTLREYQKMGVDWLNFLREYQLGGILSDDMGLGKTVQTLAHILIEKESGRLDKPVLIVAPTSLMQNWRSEAKLFTPTLKVLVLQGQDRKFYFDKLKEADIVLTTYSLIVRDKEELLKHDYYMIILDEAQFAKNTNTKAYQILQQIQASHRLCLTGTPMENHLGELWSLFNFLSPGLLGSAKQFTQIFKTPIEKQDNDFRKKSLAQRIKPYMLRRTKEEVILELPPKTEITHNIVLEEEQRDLYESIRLAMESKIKTIIQEKGLGGSQLIILDALLKLRQVSCDPRLLDLEQAKKIKQSAKLNFLLEMLTELIAEGRKILIFSSFTSMLSLIEEELKKENWKYVKLTGSTIDRATPIQQFQNGEVSVFLISLKAGGTGLNLTRADTVIHYDPWWNPAAESQATDRAHRIGQTKPVFVYKLVTTGTVEEKILKMQQKKRALLDSIFDENTTSKSASISAEDLKFLFQPLEDLEG